MSDAIPKHPFTAGNAQTNLSCIQRNISTRFRGLLADVLQCSMPPSGGMYGAQTMSLMCLVSVNSPKRQQREALRQGVTGQQLEDKHNIEA